MTELEQAYRIAAKVLDRPYADPDDDLAVLARQFLRSRELADKAVEVADRCSQTAAKLALRIV